MAFESIAKLRIDEPKRDKLVAFVSEFNRKWTKDALVRYSSRLSKLDDDVRLATVEELIKVDLGHRWANGSHVRIESYVNKLSELIDADSVSVDLIITECKAAQRAGKKVTASEIKKRFPMQASEVIRRLTAKQPQAEKTDSESDKSRRATQVERATDFKPSPETIETVAPSNKSTYANKSPDIPERFGKYQVVRNIGSGGMGAVYLAHDPKLDRMVALKVPHRHLTADPDILRRFQTEARAAAALNHPNICTIHDIGEFEGYHYLALEYVEGSDLCDIIAKQPYSPEQVAKLILALARTLEFAHQRKVIHRDLKPANIRIKPDGEPIIMDFGLARMAREGHSSATQTGLVMGTLSYMPPEQARGETKKMGPQCDVYSLGAMMYELLVGQPPFVGDSVAVLSQLLTNEPKPIKELNDSVPPELASICHSAMQKATEDRFESMTDFANALEHFLAGQPVQLPQPKVRKKTIIEPAAATQIVETAPTDRTRMVRPSQRTKVAAAENMPARRGWIAVLVSCLLVGTVAIGGGVGWSFWNKPGSVTFHVEPAGISFSVEVDGVSVSPDQVHNAQAGNHVIRIKSNDHSTYQQVVSVKRGANSPVYATLRKLRGSVSFSFREPIDEANLDILLDGKKQDADFLDATRELDVGEYELEINSENYRQLNQKFTIASGKERRVTLTFQKKTGSVIFDITPSNLPTDSSSFHLTLDGETVTPSALQSGMELEIGEHRIAVAGRKYEGQSIPFTVKADEQLKKTIALKEYVRRIPRPAASLAPLEPRSRSPLPMPIRNLQPLVVQKTAMLFTPLPDTVDLTKYEPDLAYLEVTSLSGSSIKQISHQRATIGIDLIYQIGDAEVRIGLRKQEEKYGILVSVSQDDKKLTVADVSDRLQASEQTLYDLQKKESNLKDSIAELQRAIKVCAGKMQSASLPVRAQLANEISGYDRQLTTRGRQLRTLRNATRPRLQRTIDEMSTMNLLHEHLVNRPVHYRIMDSKTEKPIASTPGH
ncbi:MAG: protein kinase [Planctomycetales bacterium]|nr:protein kinase [Planctomycetales bacterium]